MYMPELDMGLPDYAVSRAIPELDGGERYITIEDIAHHIGCSTRTVQRAIAKLMAANRLKRLDGGVKQGGYRYHVKN
jgi:predicted transcriptional regulator